MKNDNAHILRDKRIRVIVGHYGSGKTEFSVNYAFRLAEQGRRTALVDLDIANPYFRSREKQSPLQEKGIRVYSNTFGYDITADLPAIAAGIKAPLEDLACDTVVDAGGDDLGARILIQFDKYWRGGECDLFCVVNANRRETGTVDGAMSHIIRIEAETNLKVTGLINNTHLLRETTAADILKGWRVCRELSDRLGIPIKYNCCVENLIPEVENLISGHGMKGKGPDDFQLFPMHLHMRDCWLDR